MPFNLDKYKLMYVGYANHKFDYSLQGKRLEPTNVEKNLSVVISRNFQFLKQCIEVEKNRKDFWVI